VFDAEGRFKGYRGVAADITERNRTEEELQDRQDRIEQLEEAQRKLERQGEDLVRLADDLLITRNEARAADHAKTEFLANMSHELRTPLNAIIGFSEMIRGETLGPVGNPKYVEYVTYVHESGLHLLDLINDILDNSRIESGKTELHEAIVDVSGVLRSCLTVVRGRAETGDVEIDLDVAPNLPALRADERRLKQILINLLSNAIKFTPAGGPGTAGLGC
jgi:two-component system cell cycle sensor histidine kinase PleC